MVHAAVGVLVGDGRLDPAEPAAVPAWAGTPKGAITLVDLLEMRPGLRFVESYVEGEPSHCLDMLFGDGADDHAAYAAALPLDHPPGTVWNYSSGTTNIVCRILGDLVGGGEPGMRAFLDQRLFGPAGMPDADPRFDAAGTWAGSSYVHAPARQFARFGELYLNDGMTGGTRVLPAGWVDHARTVVAHDPETGFGYGRHWWMWPDQPGSLAAHGYEGQYLVVLPERDAVLVHLGKTDSCRPRPAGRPPSSHHRVAVGGAGGFPDLMGRAKPSGAASGSTSKVSVPDPQFASGAPALETGELPPITRDPSRPVPRPRFKPVRLTFKVLVFVAVVYFVLFPLIPGFRSAADELTRVQPIFLVGGVVLQMSAWFSYSLMTRSALGPHANSISRLRMFRIQMSSKALGNIVPGGSAASSALGYRLLTLSGISGPDAGFALATAGLGSAVVLNLLFWTALLVSIPAHRGANPLYVTAALAGVLIMVFAAFLILGLLHGQGRAERVLRWFAVKLRFDADTAADALRKVGERVEDLVENRAVLGRVVLGATCAWLLDATSLWVFIRAFGSTLNPLDLLIAFGLANIVAVIPITPGGLGIVEGVYIPTLVGFGLPRRVATLGVASYRLAQYWLPILLGGILYASLRVGPWSIERRDRLDRLRDIANRETDESERRIEFAMRSWERKVAEPPADGDAPAGSADSPPPKPATEQQAPPAGTAD